MSRQIKGMLYFLITNLKHNFIIFWTILLSTSFVSLIIAYLLMNTGDTSMVFALSIAIYIFAMFCGFHTAKQCIPFSIKLGATRKNIFISIAIFFIGLSLLKALLVSAVHAIFGFITKTFEIDSYVLMHPAELLADTWLNRIVIDTTVMFFFLSLMFLVGLIFYRYGLLGGGSVAGIAVIILLTGLAQGWIVDFFINVYESFSLTFFYQVLLVGVVLYAISWALLRRITILIVK